jgi:hypothetical protein
MEHAMSGEVKGEPEAIETPAANKRREFLRRGGALTGAAIMSLVPDAVRQGAWAAGSDAPEKTELKIGFIPLTDCSSVVMASVMEFDRSNGNVGIKHKPVSGYALAIAGYTLTDELVIENPSAWPDYVFETGYNLAPLAEVEQFIKTNKHLPDVPSAEDVKQNGLKVGDMNAILLKKVEELTLHMIRLEKDNKRLQEEVTELKKK